MKHQLMLSFAVISASLLMSCTLSANSLQSDSLMRNDLTEISNFEMNEVIKKASKNFICPNDTTFGADVKIYTTTNTSIQWPLKIGDNNIKVLQDSILAAAYGPGMSDVDGAIAKFVNSPILIEEGQKIQAVTEIPDASETARILSNESYISVVSTNERFMVYKMEFSYYGGGAHPGYNASYLNYDVKRNRVLDYKSIFKPGYDKAILEAIKGALCEKYSVSTVGELEEKVGIFAQDIFLSHNLYFKDYEIVFYYNPYDIGPWALGVVEVPVASYLLEKYMKPDAISLFRQSY